MNEMSFIIHYQLTKKYPGNHIMPDRVLTWSNRSDFRHLPNLRGFRNFLQCSTHCRASARRTGCPSQNVLCTGSPQGRMDPSTKRRPVCRISVRFRVHCHSRHSSPVESATANSLGLSQPGYRRSQPDFRRKPLFFKNGKRIIIDYLPSFISTTRVASGEALKLARQRLPDLPTP